MAEHNYIGQKGEELACAFLTKKGFKIIQKNWRTGNYEVDIIAQKNDLIIFVEVKTRTSTYIGQPEVFVTKQKQKNILNAAQKYAEKFQSTEEFRFDIISVIFKNKQEFIYHIEDAYKSSWR